MVDVKIFNGDCLDVLKNQEDGKYNLIVTSPPYADSRKNDYGGIHPNEYVEWFLPRSEQFLRVLNTNGSFVLNIKEKVVNGERHTYVLELILALRKQGWLWTEEYIWSKKNCMPGKWPNRFRDAWERCLHFTKSKHFVMNQESVMLPMKDSTRKRLSKKCVNDDIRRKSSVNSGFGANISNWENREKVFPTNVINLSTECGNKNHSAAFPNDLVNWFIKLFSNEGDTILDPFVGSGTTLECSKKLNRNSVGIEKNLDYYNKLEKKFYVQS